MAYERSMSKGQSPSRILDGGLGNYLLGGGNSISMDNTAVTKEQHIVWCRVTVFHTDEGKK